MPDYKNIGDGAFWIKEGKNGKYFSGEIKFIFEGDHKLKVRMLIFKNSKATGNQPEYKAVVSTCEWVDEEAGPKRRTPAKEKSDDDVPF